MSVQGSAGGSVVESLPTNARETGSIPDPGISHMPWRSEARMPQLLNQAL